MRGLFSILLLLTALVQGVAQPLRDSVALEAFMDGVIQMQLNDKHIVGATITIVKDGKVELDSPLPEGTRVECQTVDPVYGMPQEFWDDLQVRHKAGEVISVLPYKESRRLPHAG